MPGCVMTSTNVDPGLLGFGRELIARDVDRLDLRLGRQLLPFEAVHADDRVGPGNVAQSAAPSRPDRPRAPESAPASRSSRRRGWRDRRPDWRAPTVTDSAMFFSGRTTTCLLSPRLTRTSRSRPSSNPGELRADAVAAERPGSRTSPTRCPSSSRPESASPSSAASRPMSVTVASGITAPLGSATVTINLPRWADVWLWAGGCACAGLRRNAACEQRKSENVCENRHDFSSSRDDLPRRRIRRSTVRARSAAESEHV